MPDLSAGFDYPNPYGLMASDFSYDMDSYDAALKFLSDLAGGTEEARALEINGGTRAMFADWERSDKFRRVLSKCRQAGAEEREAAQARLDAEAEAETAEAQAGKGRLGQQYLTQEEGLAQLEAQGRRTFFSHPRRESWGG